MFLDSIIDLQFECALAASTLDEDTRDNVRGWYAKVKERELLRANRIRVQQFEMEHGGDDDAA